MIFHDIMKYHDEDGGKTAVGTCIYDLRQLLYYPNFE